MCIHCGETIEAGDDYQVVPQYPSGEHGSETRYHRDCFLRSIIGSVAHLQGRCSCFVVGSVEGDPPELTRREAASAAVRLFHERTGGAPMNL